MRENNAEDQLLILPVGDPDGIANLEKLLGISLPVTQMPHVNPSKNKARTFSDHLKLNLNKIIHPIYAWLAPRITAKQVQQVVEADLHLGTTWPPTEKAMDVGEDGGNDIENVAISR